MAALEIASGQVYAQTTEQKKREDFRRFLDAVIAELPSHKEIHLILDNYCTHKKNADWLAKYSGRVQFHFTPTSASWLNQVEIWFGLLTRKAFRGASFASKDHLRSAIEAFVARTNEHPKPFHWRKREVKGSQLAQYDYQLMQLSTRTRRSRTCALRQRRRDDRAASEILAENNWNAAAIYRAEGVHGRTDTANRSMGGCGTSV